MDAVFMPWSLGFRAGVVLAERRCDDHSAGAEPGLGEERSGEPGPNEAQARSEAMIRGRERRREERSCPMVSTALAAICNGDVQPCGALLRAAVRRSEPRRARAQGIGFSCSRPECGHCVLRIPLALANGRSEGDDGRLCSLRNVMTRPEPSSRRAVTTPNEISWLRERWTR
jgi:hypothetical protein